MTFSVCCGSVYLASGLTYEEAVSYIVCHQDEYPDMLEVFPDDGILCED